MNKIERVRAALRGEPVDRIPASFWFHFPAAALEHCLIQPASTSLHRWMPTSKHP